MISNEQLDSIRSHLTKVYENGLEGTDAVNAWDLVETLYNDIVEREALLVGAEINTKELANFRAKDKTQVITITRQKSVIEANNRQITDLKRAISEMRDAASTIPTMASRHASEVRYLKQEISELKREIMEMKSRSPARPRTLDNRSSIVAKPSPKAEDPLSSFDDVVRKFRELGSGK